MSRLLQGKRILVTRPIEQAKILAELIMAEGGEAICFPLIEIVPIDDTSLLDAVIARLDAFPLVVFVSPNAVAFSLPRILAQHGWPVASRAVAVGPGTAARLASFGVQDILMPEQCFDSEALLLLEPLQRSRINGKRILILRGDGGRELLSETLQVRGAFVERVACYRRKAPMNGAAIMSLLCNNGLDALTLSSSEGLRNLLGLFDTASCKHIFSLPLFVSHQRIATEAIRLGFRRVIQTESADAGLVDGLCTYNWFDHE